MNKSKLFLLFAYLKFDRILAFILTLIIFCCCSGEDLPGNSDNPQQDDTILTMKISPDTLKLTADGKSNGNFIVSLNKVSSFFAKSEKDWCILSDADGYGKISYTINVKVNINKEKKERLSKIYFYCDNLVHQAYVLQNAGQDDNNSSSNETGKNEIGGTLGTPIDLGLSVKWSSHNLGASKQEDPGEYFAWGELFPKDNYIEDNYEHFDYDEVTYNYIGDNISGTKYDAATSHWGKGWRIPTENEFKELMDKCEWKWGRVGEIKGYKILGPNGNSIFIPICGLIWGKSMCNNSIEIYLWSANINEKKDSECKGFIGDSDNYGFWNHKRFMGIPIRPVKDIESDRNELGNGDETASGNTGGENTGGENAGGGSTSTE